MRFLINRSLPICLSLGFVFLINILLKLPFSTVSSISNDEAFSIFYAQYPLDEIIKSLIKDPNPPFYLLTLHFWIKLFGISELSVRGFSVLLSSMSASLVYLIGRKYISDKAGWISALLYSFSWANIYYAHEVRTFSLILFLASLSIYSYLNLFHSERKTIWAGILLVCTLALMWAHYLTVFLFFVQFIFSFLFFKKSKSGFYHYVTSQFIALILFIPWIVLVFNSISDGVFWLQPPSFNDLFSNTYKLAGSRLSLFFILALTLLFFLFKRKEVFFRYDKVNFLLVNFFLAIWLVPILLEFIIGQIEPMFILRYFLYAGIGLFLLQGYLISSISNKYVKYGILSIGVIFIFTNFSLAPKKEEDWKEAASYLSEFPKSNNAIILCAPYKARDLFYYLDRDLFRNYNTFESQVDNRIFRYNNASEIQTSFKTYNNLFLVLSHESIVDPNNSVLNYFNQMSKCVDTNRFDRITIYRFIPAN